MPIEHCAVCGSTTPFDDTVHVMLNPVHEEGVDDHYVCRGCYDDHLADLFAYRGAPNHWEVPNG